MILEDFQINLVPWVSFDLWKLEFSIVRIQALNFLSGLRHQYLIPNKPGRKKYTKRRLDQRLEYKSEKVKSLEPSHHFMNFTYKNLVCKLFSI